MKIVVLQNGNRVFAGHPADAREHIEDLFQAKYGFCPSLQEDISEDDEYLVYLHTDTYDECSQEQLDLLEKLKLNDEPYGDTEVFKSVLNLEFRLE